MTTLEKLQNELKEAKFNLNVAARVSIVIEAFNNQEKFVFESFSGTKNLFRNDQAFFNFGRLSLTFRAVKHFDEIHKVSFGKNHPETKELKAALKFIEANAENDKVWNILHDLANENFK